MKSNLAAVTWVTPTYANSDHGGNGSDTGPSWVASVVNALGESQFCDSTAIFIFWDDAGGWYDPEPPRYVSNDSLGYRLPLLIISPYAKQGFVSHTNYEHGSILKFVEEQFGLAQFSVSDKRAKSPADALNFTSRPGSSSRSSQNTPRGISEASRSILVRRTTINGIVRRLSLAIAATTLLLCGCKGGASSMPDLPAADWPRAKRHTSRSWARKKLSDVSSSFNQENRSLNNLFYGYPGAKTVTYGLDSKNQKITLKPISLAVTWDVSHSYQAFIAACNGKGKDAGDRLPDERLR